MYEKVTRFCEIAVTIQYVQTFISAVTFNLAPLYNNYKNGMFGSEKPINGTYEHSVYYLLPFDTNSEMGYIVVSLYNWYVSFSLSTIFVGHDFLICVFLFHIWGHMKIFEHDLYSFPRPKVTTKNKKVPMQYSQQENKEVKLKLKEVIVHYMMIKE